METIEFDPKNFQLMPYLPQPDMETGADRVDMTGADMSPVADYHFTQKQGELKFIPTPSGVERFALKIQTIQYDHNTGGIKQTHWTALDVRGDLLPYPERRYLKNREQLANVGTFVVRPLNPLTRDALDTPRGFVLLLNWLNNCPRLSTGYNFAAMLPRVMAGTPAPNVAIAAVNNWRSPMSAFDNTIFHPAPVLMATLSAPSDHLALFLSYLHGEPVRDADTFNRLSAATWQQPETVAAMVKIYQYQRTTFDAMFATYELFRAENFAAIADDAASWNGTPADRIHAAQVAAVRNLLYTYTRYHVHPRAKADDSDENLLLEYENPLRVARDTAKTLNIPADILAEATGRPKAKTAKKQTTGPDRVGKKDGKMSFLPVTQRTFRPRQTNLIAELYNKHNDLLNITWTPENVNQLIFRDTADFKRTVALMYLITTKGNVDANAISKKVTNTINDKMSSFDPATQSRADVIDEIWSELDPLCTFTLNVRDVVSLINDEQRSRYVSPFFDWLQAQPFEPWIVQYYDKKKKRKLGFIHTGPRFTIRGIDVAGKQFKIEELKTSKIDDLSATVRISVDPVFFLRLSRNYLKLDEPFMTLIDTIPATGTSKMATIKLLLNLQRCQYAVADAVAERMKNAAKKNKHAAPTAEQLRTARRECESLAVVKTDFVDDMLANTPPPAEPATDNKKPRTTNRRSRGNTKYYIDHAEHVFQSCVDNGTILKAYQTHPDDAGTWILTFKLD